MHCHSMDIVINNEYFFLFRSTSSWLNNEGLMYKSFPFSSSPFFYRSISIEEDTMDALF